MNFLFDSSNSQLFGDWRRQRRHRQRQTRRRVRRRHRGFGGEDRFGRHLRQCWLCAQKDHVPSGFAHGRIAGRKRLWTSIA